MKYYFSSKEARTHLVLYHTLFFSVGGVGAVTYYSRLAFSD